VQQQKQQFRLKLAEVVVKDMAIATTFATGFLSMGS
jgi:hypothetical protein